MSQYRETINRYLDTAPRVVIQEMAVWSGDVKATWDSNITPRGIREVNSFLLRKAHDRLRGEIDDAEYDDIYARALDHAYDCKGTRYDAAPWTIFYSVAALHPKNASTIRYVCKNALINLNFGVHGDGYHYAIEEFERRIKRYRVPIDLLVRVLRQRKANLVRLDHWRQESETALFLDS